MLTNPDLMNQARQIKQRYFGESLMATLSKEGSHQTDSIEGMISFAQRRIVVSFPVGILLTVVLLISSLQIGLVTGYTRLNERPLNLSHDPSSVIAMASLISTGQNTRALFEGLDTASQEWMRKQLGRNIFYLRHGVLYSYDVRDTYQFSETSSHAIAAYNAANSKNWRPKVLQLWFLGPLLVSLFAIIIALSLLFALFQNHGIAQVHIASPFDPSRNNPTFIDLAPYSIFPVLMVVGLKLWWDSMDQKLRKLQPFVSMVKEPPGVFNGSKLSYVATPILWLVWKAARNRHLLLALVAVGAVLLEILTISISGLWDRKLGYSKHNATLMRAVDLRTLPTIFTVPSAANDTMNSDVKGTLANVFGQMSNEWLYSATTEGISNVSILPWTSGEWAFAPLNLSSASKPLSVEAMEDESHAMITIDTPSIRGRLQCEPIDMSNISSWLTVLDFTDKSLWSDTHIPSDLEIGYELKEGLSRNQSLENGTYKFWDDNTPYFSFFAAEYMAQCCGKELNGTPGKASFGYWSSAADARHSSVVVKWVTGRAFSALFRDSKNQTHLTWKEVPQVTALKCDPVYEVANARVKADAKSGFIQHHEITDIPSPDSNAWSNKYRALNVSSGVPYANIPSGAEGFEVEPSRFVHNVSVSYGYLFNDMLLSAANSARLGNLASEQYATENLSDRTFNFRLPGLNVDLMSYTSLALVKNNSSALLDPNILGNISSTVFSMFFKHFVHAPVSPNIGLYANGSWGLQPRGATLPQDLGATIDSLSTVYLQNIPQPSKTAPFVEGVVVERVEQLEFNPAAVVLSLCILGFLFMATVVILAAHKKHLDHLPRDVDTLGSILGFVYSSDRLLRIATIDVDGGSVNEKIEFLGPTKMGWFNGSGKRRWGIEIVDEREEARTSAPVNTERAREESMDFPIQGFRTTSVSEADGAGGAYGETPQKAARSSTADGIKDI
ncbi:hypothetical protein B0O99DRAFT_613050 [Bisporella sp. PMI_857]|nr:hypothetical protein B0O99DRAFT_613050 [Bisporella sp. PMI_857]